MRPQVGQLVNNKYRLLRLIGDGGMGSVFEARHEVLGTSVALKFLHSELTRRAGLVQRFLQEARVVVRIQSPHVVRVSDVDQTPEGNAFIVMEYIEGKSLQALYEELYRAGKRLSYPDAMDYALQMLDGLEAAHGTGIVHRDLKPDNVMLTRGPKGSPLLKILDFGIAKLKVEGEHMKGLTRPGVVMGTPEYMAPEQAFSADQVDARADIFAFGVMLFEMLAGRRPVGGDEPHQIAAQYLGGEVAKLTDLAPHVPAGLATVVHKAMEAQAKDRWSSVQELRQAIEPYADLARGGGANAAKASDASRAPSSPIKADGEVNPSGAAQVLAAVGASAASEVDGGATEKVDGLPAMMLVGGGTAEGVGPSASRPQASPANGGAFPPIVAPAAAVSPVHHVTPTSASSPMGTPVPHDGGLLHGAGAGLREGAPWATEPVELDPLRPGANGAQYTSTEGFSPLDVRPGATDVGAALIGGTAIDPGAPAFVGTAPMTPAGGFVAPPPYTGSRRKKKGSGVAWLLFLATTITGAVLGAIFLWDRLDLGEGADPDPIATTEPAPINVDPAPTTPPAPVTNAPAAVVTSPPAPPPTSPPPPPPATTQRPPPPRPPPTQPAQPQPPPPTLPTLQWPPPPTMPTLPPLIPINPPPPQQQPDQPQPQPQPQPSSTGPRIPWRPKLPGRTNTPSTDASPEDPPAGRVIRRPTTPSSPSRPSSSASSRPRVVLPRR